ncbi:MAG: hypothetical protein ACI85O_000198 [Saprospiraceae bacterium]|jgi:hypothetical protein
MKQLFVLFAFLGFVSFSATAQSCNPAACKKTHKTSSVDATQTGANVAAVKLASLDETIETKTCATSGKVSFTRKNVSTTSGKVSYTNVEYCSKSAKFVNVSPSAKASCSKSKASCSAAKGASAKQVSTEAAPKKACCAKGTSKEACAKMKAASAKQVSLETAPKKACCAKGSASSCAGKAKTGAKVEARTATEGKVKLISNKN